MAGARLGVITTLRLAPVRMTSKARTRSECARRESLLFFHKLCPLPNADLIETLSARRFLGCALHVTKIPTPPSFFLTFPENVSAVEMMGHHMPRVAVKIQAGGGTRGWRAGRVEEVG